VDVAIRTLNGVDFIDLTGKGSLIQHEGDLHDLLSLCYYHQTNIVLLSEKNLSLDFFDLRSGLAGAAMQKFSNYKVKAAIIMTVGAEQSERFKELMFEVSSSSHIRFYVDQQEAEAWLTQ